MRVALKLALASAARRGMIVRSPLALLAASAVAWLVGILWVLPFVGIFMTSVRPYREVIIHGWWSLSPFTLTLDNYLEVLFNPIYGFARSLLNSLIVAVPSTIIPVSLAALAAYAFARFSFPLRDYLFAAMLLLMAVPQQMVVVTLFFMLRSMGLLDTFQGIVLVHSAWGIPWITFFLRNYFSLLPVEVEEAARVDGASYGRVFLEVVLPLALPGIVSAAVLQFVWVWNDFFFALMLLLDPAKMVVTQKLPWLKGEYHVDWGLLAAGSVVAMSVPIIVYAVLSRYFLRGFTGWALKA